MWDCGAVARRDNAAVCMTALIIFFLTKKRLTECLPHSVWYLSRELHKTWLLSLEAEQDSYYYKTKRRLH